MECCWIVCQTLGVSTFGNMARPMELVWEEIWTRNRMRKKKAKLHKFRSNLIDM